LYYAMIGQVYVFLRAFVTVVRESEFRRAYESWWRNELTHLFMPVALFTMQIGQLWYRH
jgi:hypothetical protein